MLREEELNNSSDSDTRPASRPSREKDFSFIQNRVPSPLHNNFLLSEEQSRHMRQPSDNFTLPHNLMTQDEFKNPSFSSFQSNNQQSLIIMMMHQNKIDERDEENEGSSSGEEDGTPQVEFETSQMSIFTADQPSQLHHHQQNNMAQNQHNQILVTESNNDDFNYSESNYQFAGSSSIGAILQNNNGGSFVNNYQQNQVLAYNYNPPLLSGRQSATPLNYDNSLMNLSYTPASQNIASSQLVIQNNRQIQDEEVSQGQIEEQDQSMIKTQDVWFNSKKNNPLEMPLQMNDQLFSRAKLTEESFLFQQQVEQQEQIQKEQQDLQSESEVGDSEIKMIKKKLDFSRLSLLQNASQQQLNNQQFPNSFLFQTYQSQLSNNANNHSLSHNDTQHYSTCGAIENPLSQIAIPFEQLLTDRGLKSRNSGTYNTVSTTNNNKLNKTKDEGVQVEHDRFSCGTVSKESSISPPLSKAKTSLNSTRPPLLKQITPSQYKEGQEQIQKEISVFPKKITVSNGNQPIQLNCINIFQNGPSSHPLLQHYQVPTQTRSTSSTNFIDSKKPSQRPKNKLTLNICQPDTPGEPSQSLIIDPYSNENVVSTTNNQRKIVKLLTNQMMHSLDDTVNELQQLNDKIKVMASSKESGKQKQVKIKKKTQKVANENQINNQGEQNRQQQLQQQQISSRAGDTSRQRRQESNNGKKQPNVMGFMSKTMIISKDKILPAKGFYDQQSKQQQIIENIIQSNHQIQKYKLQKVKKAKVVPVVSSQNPLLNHPPLQSGRSLPNSNLSSAQTSFLTTTTQNIKKIAPQQKTTSKKIVEDKMNKLKKKNNSIVRQHIMNGTGNQTQKVKEIIVESQHQQHKQISKCNTQRSVSRPKSGYRNENNLEIVGAGNNQSLKKFGRKKHSQQIFTSTTESVNSNKENIRPTSSTQGLKPQKKSFQMVGAPLNRPEQMLQSYENIKLVNAQELLKEIYVQQQKLSVKNFQNLFSTMDGNVDISKRVKTEEASSYHLKNATSNIVLDQDYLEAYPIQHTQVSQSIDTQRMLMLQKLNQNEIYENLYKAGGITSSLQNINNNTQNFMQRMQSPYNSKSMKNKFNSNKNRKVGETVQMAQIKPMTSCQSEQQMNECKRCDELMFLLKNTRYVGR